MNKTLEFRAHHLFCMSVSRMNLSGRGEEFQRTIEGISDSLQTGKNFRIKIAAATDRLCLVCPDYQNGRCQNEFGDETQVRKLDAIILNELELKIGDEMPIEEFRSMVAERAPLKICRRCQWKNSCYGDLGVSAEK